MMITHLETLHSQVKHPSVALDEAVALVSKSGELYAQFQSSFAKDTMDVTCVEVKADGTEPRIVPFAWKNL